jgi:hypothetical protein
VGKRGDWYLGLLAVSGQEPAGALFVHEDGRCLHFNHLQGNSVLMGYGWFTGVMHYVEVDRSFHEGRSQGLFVRESTPRLELTPLWFKGFARSLYEFYSPHVNAARETISGKIHVIITDQQGRKKTVTGILSEDISLATIFRNLGTARSFAIESEELMEDRRSAPSSTSHSAPPLAAIRYVAGQNQALIYRSYYVSKKKTIEGENALPEDIRRSLRFPGPLVGRSETVPN